MVKVAESKRLAMSFFQPLLGKEEPARARCGLSLVHDTDASTRAGSGRASLKATTLHTKQTLKINSMHERATFAAASYLSF